MRAAEKAKLPFKKKNSYMIKSKKWQKKLLKLMKIAFLHQDKSKVDTNVRVWSPAGRTGFSKERPWAISIFSTTSP